MRVILAVLVAIALPVSAVAQSKGSHRRLSSSHVPTAGWTSNTSTLPPIGLPLPPIGLAPPSKPQFKGRFSRFDFKRNPYANPFSSVVYVVPPFYPGIFAPYTDIFSPDLYSPTPGMTPLNHVTPVPPPPPLPPPPPPPPATGWLRLDLEEAPSSSQAFVDGYFVGTLDDLNSQLMLETGPHKIEVQAPGYTSIGFDVKIVADRSITYQATLEKIEGVARRPQPRLPPSTIYFIPGCYLGNVPPQQAALPATCDVSKLSTYKP
jgi:hypothetical protein